MEEFLKNHAKTFDRAEIYLCMSDDFADVHINIDVKGRTIIIGDYMKLDYSFKTGELVKIYITKNSPVVPEAYEEMGYE